MEQYVENKTASSTMRVCSRRNDLGLVFHVKSDIRTKPGDIGNQLISNSKAVIVRFAIRRAILEHLHADCRHDNLQYLLSVTLPQHTDSLRGLMSLPTPKAQANVLLALNLLSVDPGAPMAPCGAQTLAVRYIWRETDVAGS